MRVLLAVAALAALAAAAAAYETEHYRGYKLLTAVPKDAAQVDAINAVGQWRDVDMFSHRVAPGKRATLMVPPGSLLAVEKVFKEKGVLFEVSSHDVQESVNAEYERQHKAVVGRAVSVLPTFDRFMRYAEIQQFLKNTESTYPNLVKLESAGKSFEGRDLSYVRISKNGGTSSRAIIVDAGIHAREWIAPPVAIYLIQQLVTEQATHAAMMDDLDWYIMPLVNPDGYEYTHTRERFWRKNRSTRSSRWCPGTDVNRNFGFHYKQSGASNYPCSETYAGSAAFSEPESQIVRDFLQKINADRRVKMYLTLHSYGPMILYPWGYDYNLPDAEDKDELVSIANEANAAIVAAGSEPFEVMNSAGLYPAAGASDDWAKGSAGIAKAYTIELQDGGRNGFDMPPDRILEVVTQVFEGIKVFAARAKKL